MLWELSVAEQRYRAVLEVGIGVQVTRSSVYRTLVRNGLVEPKSRRRRRKDYRRWERAAAMELWQLDVTASAFLTDGTEVKTVTGMDDHSRFCVIATAVRRATARPVCLAFVDAMRVYGVPEEVLTDNGKVFTGRFHKPGVPVEVLFDRICRENGITHRLTKIHSPPLTGQSLDRLPVILPHVNRESDRPGAWCRRRVALTGAGRIQLLVSHA